MENNIISSVLSKSPSIFYNLIKYNFKFKKYTNLEKKSGKKVQKKQIAILDLIRQEIESI